MEFSLYDPCKVNLYISFYLSEQHGASALMVYRGKNVVEYLLKFPALVFYQLFQLK